MQAASLSQTFIVNPTPQLQVARCKQRVDEFIIPTMNFTRLPPSWKLRHAATKRHCCFLYFKLRHCLCEFNLLKFIHIKFEMFRNTFDVFLMLPFYQILKLLLQRTFLALWRRNRHVN
ncbi:uncharacterized protein LOC107481036 isoform X1 [Arachis duranensis]|uniref:Uncharacterized protein LOC107481036 isoform X1 n=1 Tax=Arachis duranensis TaxID=130453 RepID=A0A9C6T943_ARADU|nr:uncharacterized protein LOC107481036 isoform X1 [Arachis duranensis]